MVADFNVVQDGISCEKFSKMGNAKVPCAPSKLHQVKSSHYTQGLRRFVHIMFCYLCKLQ
jgi:hypothetical protein